jgi:hypothetical protein
MPGYYIAIGDGMEQFYERDDKSSLVRLYWNLTREGSVLFIAAVTEIMNSARIPFRAKVLSEPWSYVRADAGVLYVARDLYPQVESLVPQILERVRSGLRLLTPMFTKQLAPGLGLAEDPGGGFSFGQHRCRLTAVALLRSYVERDQEHMSREETLLSVFRSSGLDPDLPYLDCGSKDQYRSIS